MSEHSPGPWSRDTAHMIRDEKQRPIAFAFDTEVSSDVAAANATLIAAAPDLLSALIGAEAELAEISRNSFDYEYLEDGDDSLLARIRSTISKATEMGE